MLNKKIGLAVLLAGFAASDVMAVNTLTNYTSGDVLLCFRKPGNFDLVVDIGPITTLTGLSANQRYPITSYTGTQLGQVGTNGVDWSAFADTNSGATLFMTRPRLTLSVAANAWTQKTGGSQTSVAGRIEEIPPGAVDNFGAGLNNPNSTSSAVIEEDSSVGNVNYQAGGLSYHDALFGSYGSATFDGFFAGDPENTTLSSFTTGGTVERSDFFQLNPVPYVAGKWLGYFEFNTNGVMTYVAYPSTPAVINSVSRSGNVTTINYNSGAYGVYSLRESSDLTVPVSSWTVLQTLSNSANSVNVNDTTTDTNRFYTITAQ
jgi:hypothetical protein